MEHVVFYQSAQGVPAFRRVASLEDAVSFAEHLRNAEGVTDFSVYSLSPVTLSMRTYYHVEVSGGETSASDPASDPAAPDPAAPFGATPPAPPAGFLEPAMATNAPPLPDAPPLGTAFDAGTPAPSMSFNALEEEATAPLEDMPAPVASVQFAAAPLAPAGGASITETFVKDDPADLPAPADSAEAAPVDPNVVDPTTEEVVPSATGRRSMGFFARS
ncbi:MAG TPA: hypothetical protein VHD81_11210 [Mycobacteriales bacterium]|nr:hypothetical protein [Mycobacteriales bacterium]